MVVGPQQHWLHLNQGQFREWWFQDQMREKVAASVPNTPSKLTQQRRVPSDRQTTTPRKASGRRSILGEIDHNESSAIPNPQVQDAMLPVPTPGQPRKYLKIAEDATASDHTPLPSTDVVPRRAPKERAGSAGDEELALIAARRRKASRSPAGTEKRAVSYSSSITTTTTSFTHTVYDGDDVENAPTPPQLEAKRSGSGAGILSVGKQRTSSRNVAAGKGEMRESSGVRKNSGRVGSAGAVKLTKVASV
jgi:cell division cycle 14